MLHQAAQAQRQREQASTFYLWPCNVGAWQAFQALRTQWRTGMAGATGLDYAAVIAWLGLQGHRGAAARRLMAGIQACEAGTLQAWAELREQQQQPPALAG